jgi:ribosomal protein L25 (general stress protein Ctc)
MDQIELNASRRDVLGKKVRFLRRQGITPVHVFGHGIRPVKQGLLTLMLTARKHQGQ